MEKESLAGWDSLFLSKGRGNAGAPFLTQTGQRFWEDFIFWGGTEMQERPSSHKLGNVPAN